MPTRKPELTGLTHELWQAFKGKPVPCRMRGVCLVLDGEPLAVAGYADHGHCLEVFSEVTPEAKRFPIEIYRGALLVMEWVDETNLPAFATQDPNHPSASRLLERLGFYRAGTVNNEEVWRY